MFDTEIAWLASTGITQGRADGTYGLNDPVTRGAMAAFHAAAVWISADGLSWQRIVHDDAVFGVGRQSMSSVTTGGPGLVAVGFDLNRDAAAGWTRP